MPDLWLALRDIVLFWVGEGVRIFRVDNPHTKPLPFWEWMIADIRGRHPDVIFLAEAFTRPKMMYRLAQDRLHAVLHLLHLAQHQGRAHGLLDRAHDDRRRRLSFARTSSSTRPTSIPSSCRRSGRAGFLIRAALAATLSGLWGIYSGFELCEAAPCRGARNISIRRSTRSASGTSPRPATSWPRSPPSTACASCIRRCTAISG